MIEQIKYKIYCVRKEIFQDDFAEGTRLSVEVLQSLLKCSTFDQAAINDIAQAMMQAMQQQDYLLLADIVYFDIPKLWKGTEADIDAVLQPKFTFSKK